MSEQRISIVESGHVSVRLPVPDNAPIGAFFYVVCISDAEKKDLQESLEAAKNSRWITIPHSITVAKYTASELEAGHFEGGKFVPATLVADTPHIVDA